MSAENPQLEVDETQPEDESLSIASIDTIDDYLDENPNEVTEELPPVKFPEQELENSANEVGSPVSGTALNHLEEPEVEEIGGGFDSEGEADEAVFPEQSEGEEPKEEIDPVSVQEEWAASVSVVEEVAEPENHTVESGTEEEDHQEPEEEEWLASVSVVDEIDESEHTSATDQIEDEKQDFVEEDSDVIPGRDISFLVTDEVVDLLKKKLISQSRTPAKMMKQ